ncbi:tRNA pseudouridine(55) synthase TruB [Acetobacterium woodii]|uniref:tRNA pseudouridine synthase B n=1 Tax=Acetobacterium woodii (strain ATCC 29683 / DSM 1030 / JCM 2381 / KCTC 1655 / WB1) TaxID=931626 RepID=H6LJX3_ACEWD|nr:tRNA pseudouridine(55) synthase TruB [Acetobacterium woodii]AFA48727.1 tRNA pseudouridine synthase B [Acetobacterium woodii DSM 1030]
MEIKNYNGYLNVYKEKGMTSHDVVFKARKILKTKKIGHTGTLDPNAEGVLVLCVGQATKMVEYLTDHDKTYEAEVVLGIETDTCDSDGAILNKTDKRITKAAFAQATEQFTGNILQKPPIYSAIRVNGKKLYHYARSGEAVVIPEREVFISKLSVLDFCENSQKAKIMVTCSKGTYIRSLCRDIGKYLGSLGCMGSLIRHQVGDFSSQDALTLVEIESKVTDGLIENFFYPLEYSLESYRSVKATEQGRKFLLNGNKLYQWNIYESLDGFQQNETLRLYDDEKLVGMGRLYFNDDENYIKPTKLL